MTNRGGKGVKTISITEKTGELVTIKNVTDNDDLMIINKSGIAIRMEVSSLRVMGRATQGVKIIRLRDDDSIASVAKVSKFEEDEEISLDDEGNIIETTGILEDESSLAETNDVNQNTEENNNQKTNDNEEN